MADVPDEMMAKGRLEDKNFEDSELLYRRIRPDDIEGQKITIEAIELPDMSVNREKFGPPEWLLLSDGFENWGVFKFQVSHIPESLLQNGTIEYRFMPKHRPLKKNYPHSEVWAFRDGQHIDVKNSDILLDPDAHQRWRQQLAWKCRLEIVPE